MFARFYLIQLRCQIQKHGHLRDFNLLLRLTQNSIYTSAHNANTHQSTRVKHINKMRTHIVIENKIKQTNNSNHRSYIFKIHLFTDNKHESYSFLKNEKAIKPQVQFTTQDF